MTDFDPVRTSAHRCKICSVANLTDPSQFDIIFLTIRLRLAGTVAIASKRCLECDDGS
jgi:hypothetical protein